ncbi:MAG: chemotaxis protein CheA [Litorivicinus sp.]
MDPMLEAFIAESKENLETASTGFLSLESDPNSQTLMDEIFRAMHTLKGSSGLFDIRPFTAVVHAAEDVLDCVRAGELELTSAHVDLFFSAMDQISQWLEDLDGTGELSPGAEAHSERLSGALRVLIPSSENEPVEPTDDKPVASLQPPSWLSHFSGEERERALEIAQDGPIIAVEYIPNADCYFQGEDPLHTVRTLPGMLAFQSQILSAWPDLLELDPYQNNLKFCVLSEADIDQVQDYLRYITDQVTIYEVHAAHFLDEGEINEQVIRQEQIQLEQTHRNALLAQKELLTLAVSEASISSATTVVGRVLESAGVDTSEFETIAEKAQSSLQPNLLDDYLEEMLAPMRLPAEPEVTPEPKPIAQQTSIVDTPAPTRGEVKRNEKSKTLKVDQHRIDTLMDLVGELVVAKNALPYLARRAQEDFGNRTLAKEIESQYSVINRLSESLQGAMMQVRMVPMTSVFGRFPRLVRDLSRKLGKDIQLVMEGEDTEADKNVVEELADPLIHLVRNSLDHGLETPDERAITGKPMTGTITLRAIPQDDQVLLEIIDDGRGIDPDKIKRLALQKGVIDQARHDSLSDHEALQLIFAAGFSTAEQVSDLSGRGVGMDVVRSVVEHSGGSVQVFSELGQGSTVRLSLPLSMAVNRVMMVESAGQIFGIPMESIIETVRLPRSELTRVKHMDVAVLRDQIIPLRELRDLMQLGPAEPSDEVAVLVMHCLGQNLGLVIDEFHEGVDIIQKPLEGVLANYPYYSGAAMLGDGSVLLVLNMRELLA